ncbi:hypothetical protein GUITHDRAFT_69464 [Guillardia theta CCMP2712]|uniref:ABC transporter domain-containing protein n=1 Tax=Guillardia theta (strain CCMP2712) TaxID=905079 RepID=L1JHK7_GUITC|nr:hypothetical protein GUITHDRAFT_69464 [Guillardia theta CCMP2712]EKX47634.1 hypothetical protein GUITHDRAFT_69464 [Guillardia theta CCMP2712]|eukprot:XP_005834614.1 hypothetical protein GUITHDRAFT_69464 [Guillardia theta CCMP2712]
MQFPSLSYRKYGVHRKSIPSLTRFAYKQFFWNALNAKDLAKFNKFLALYLAVLTLGPPLLVLFDWAKGRMALSWRNALTNLYLGKYVHKMRYYKLPFVSDVDNTDQRISEDINNFCDKAVSLFCTSVVALCDLVVFSIILYKIFPPLYFTLVAYAVVGTFVTVWFGKPLIKKNRLQLKKEADFRFDLVRIREDSESIAFYNGETRERTEAQKRFSSVVANRIGILNFERNLNFFTRWYRYLVQVLPALVIGPQYFAGKVPLGAISQTFFSFNHVLNDLSLIVNEFTGPQGISSFAAQVERLDQLRTAVEKNLLLRMEASPSRACASALPAVRLTCMLRILTLLPTGNSPRQLITDLSLTLEPGKKLLVVGFSGIGKSSLMRAIAGLWDTGTGNIVRPPLEDTLFLSQRPYMTLGTLRENVLYPKTVQDSSVTDEEILEALRKVNLPTVAERMGGLDAAGKTGGLKPPLSNILSLGEQQRLAFARIMILKPKFVILDESTSALDLENEEQMYKVKEEMLLQDLGMTVVSVGNRPSLVPFHDKVLRLTGEGAWKFES